MCLGVALCYNIANQQGTYFQYYLRNPKVHQSIQKIDNPISINEFLVKKILKKNVDDTNN